MINYKYNAIVLELSTMPQNIRKEIRILGIDDSPFQINSRNVKIIATFFRGGAILDGILSTTVTKDGINSTKKIAEMINCSKFSSQIRAVLINGIAVAGFNVIDINKLHKLTKIPIIVVMRAYPDKEKMFRSLEKINQERKIGLIKDAGIIHKHKRIHFQLVGTTINKAKEIIDLSTTNSDIPEPIRVAHIIASGIIKGESKGQA